MKKTRPVARRRGHVEGAARRASPNITTQISISYVHRSVIDILHDKQTEFNNGAKRRKVIHQISSDEQDIDTILYASYE
jgi:hypothetical protein